MQTEELPAPPPPPKKKKGGGDESKALGLITSDTLFMGNRGSSVK